MLRRGSQLLSALPWSTTLLHHCLLPLLQAALGGALTPSLLDTAAASPSLVYGGGRFLATPLRSQLEALPLDAARHAPLLDSSPLSLGGWAAWTGVLLAHAVPVPVGV
jgi:hypothetical protein